MQSFASALSKAASALANLLSSWPEEDDGLAGVEPWPISGTPEEASAYQRWFVDVARWRPSQPELSFLLGLLPSDEREAVRAFRHPIDRKRTLVSRLLQRRSVATALRVPAERVVVKRTKGSKPFEASGAPRTTHVANYNFNVSHEGHLVVLASDPALLVGVDVAAPFELRGGVEMGPFADLRESFANILTEREWEDAEAAGSEAERVRAFRTRWSLKEAFVKARGDGLAFEMRRVDFQRCPRDATRQPPPVEQQWRVYLDGYLQSDWRCTVCELQEGHIVSIARGPADCAQDAWGQFRRTLARQVPREELLARLVAAPPPFERLHVRQLLPEARRGEYDEALRTSVYTYEPGVWDAAATPAQTQTQPQPSSAGGREGEPSEMPEWVNPANRGYAPQGREGLEQDCTIC